MLCEKGMTLIEAQNALLVPQLAKLQHQKDLQTLHKLWSKLS